MSDNDPQGAWWTERQKILPAPAGLQVWAVWGLGEDGSCEAYGPYPVIALAFLEVEARVWRPVERKHFQAVGAVPARAEDRLKHTDAYDLLGEAGSAAHDLEFRRVSYYALCDVDSAGSWLEDGHHGFASEEIARRVAAERTAAFKAKAQAADG